MGHSNYPQSHFTQTFTATSTTFSHYFQATNSSSVKSKLAKTKII